MRETQFDTDSQNDGLQQNSQGHFENVAKTYFVCCFFYISGMQTHNVRSGFLNVRESICENLYFV